MHPGTEARGQRSEARDQGSGVRGLTIQQEITGRSEAVVTDQLLVLVVTDDEGHQIYEG